MRPISDWRQLPFREIWVIDTEFHPGRGLANGGGGRPPSPRFVSSRWRCDPDGW